MALKTTVSRRGARTVIACALASGLMFGVTSLMAVAASAQDNCRVEDYAPPPDGCHRERIESAGRQRPFDDIFPSAKRSAQLAWERQALTKYGERYRSWDNAVCKRTECVKGSIAGMRRCTYSGFACVRNPQSADGVLVGSAQLDEREVRRLQRLLIRAGYGFVRVQGVRKRLTIDGNWGPVTRTAVALWLERENLDDSAMTERDVLNALIERYGRRG